MNEFFFNVNGINRGVIVIVIIISSSMIIIIANAIFSSGELGYYTNTILQCRTLLIRPPMGHQNLVVLTGWENDQLTKLWFRIKESGHINQVVVRQGSTVGPGVKGTPRRYHNLVLWVWLEFIFTLKR